MAISDRDFEGPGRGGSAANRLSTDEWEARVGSQFRAARITANFDQAALAARANISVGAIKNLEGGKGSTLRTIIRVSRALGLSGWLDGVSPAISISPLAMVRTGDTERSRVRRSVD